MVSGVNLLGERGSTCEFHCSPEGVTSTSSMGMGMGSTPKQIEATLGAYLILLCQPKTKRNKKWGGIIREARRVWVDTELKQAAVASQKGRPRLGQGGPRQLAPSGQTPWLRCSRPQYKGGLDEPYHLGGLVTAYKRPPKGFC